MGGQHVHVVIQQGVPVAIRAHPPEDGLDQANHCLVRQTYPANVELY